MTALWIALVFGFTIASEAQPRMITASGAQVRVWTAGLEQRRAGEPIIALEAGSGAGLDTWTPIFNDLAKVGPVVAYDRLGLGQSAADPKTPTLSRNVETLHDVLHAVAPAWCTSMSPISRPLAPNAGRCCRATHANAL